MTIAGKCSSLNFRLLFVGLIVALPFSLSAGYEEDLERNTVLVNVMNGSGARVGAGTGFLMDNGRIVVSNVHVAGTVQLREYKQSNSGAVSGEWYPVFLSADEELQVLPGSRQMRKWDITAYRVHRGEQTGFNKFRRMEDLKEGEKVWTRGNANGGGLRMSDGKIVKVLNGLSSAEDRREIDTLLDNLSKKNAYMGRTNRYDQVIVTTSFLVPGNSGGPIVDKDGNLIGMAWATSSKQSYVIPVEYVFRVLGMAIPRSQRTETMQTSVTVGAKVENAPRRAGDTIVLGGNSFVSMEFNDSGAADRFRGENTVMLGSTFEMKIPARRLGPEVNFPEKVDAARDWQRETTGREPTVVVVEAAHDVLEATFRVRGKSKDGSLVFDYESPDFKRAEVFAHPERGRFECLVLLRGDLAGVAELQFLQPDGFLIRSRLSPEN